VTAPLFWCPVDRLSADEVLLDGAEGRHAVRVRRLRAGELVDLGDGAGLVAHCEVLGVTGTGLRCRVIDRKRVARPAPRLVVAQAVVRDGEQAVTLMTEVGVDEVVPWTAKRSAPPFNAHRLARWRSAASEAAKQARRPYLPSVAEPAADLTVLLRRASLAVVLHQAADRPLSALDIPTGGEIAVVVGPEGGLTDAEVSVFQQAGATAVTVGATVLRSTTAGAVAAAVLADRSGRWTGATS
jgi:16S rRNA (uracil1498-N3)-methyltransferase